MKRMLVFMFLIQSGIALSNIDSLIRVAQGQPDTNAVLAGYELGKIFVNRSMDSSYLFLVNAAHLADSLDYTQGKLVTYRSIGSVGPRVKKYDESLYWLNKGITLIDSLNLPIKNKVDFLTNIGVAHYRMGFLGRAIETYIDAVEICRENGLNEQRSRLLNNLGIFYRNLERYEDAIDIYKQSYELRVAGKDTAGMANLLFNMATAYSKLDKHKQALTALKKAEVLYTIVQSQVDLVHTTIAKADANMILGNLEEARRLYLLAKELPYDQLQVPFNFFLYQGLSRCEFLLGNIQQADILLNKIQEDVIASDIAESKMNYYQLRAKIAEKKDDFRVAFKNLTALRDIEIEINEKDKTNFRQEMETKYLTSEKEFEIELLNTRNELTTTKLSAARTRNYGLGLGLLIFTGLILWLYKLYKTTKTQKEEISIANNDKEILLKEIHHRVKNNLQVVSSLLTLQSKYIEDENALAAINTGKTRVESMSILHRRLYEKENLKNINVKNYFEDLVENLVETYQLQDKKLEITKDIDDLDLDVDIVMPLGLITNELISNALKYAFQQKEEGKINLHLKKKGDGLILRVSDNGIGMPYDIIPVRTDTLGMQLIKSFARKINAEISIKNHQGTEFSLFIPSTKLTS